jgi:hypothetical protein
VKNPFFGVAPASSTLGRSATAQAWVLMEAFPQFNQTLFSNTEPVGYSDYNSMQVKLNKRLQGGGALVKGLSFLTSFTWSKNMVANSLLNNNNGQCPGCVEFAKPFYDIDTNDRPFDFAFSGIYGLPIGKGGIIGQNASGFLGQVLNDWTMDWIFTAASGTPVNALDNTVKYTCSSANPYQPAHRSFSEWINNENPSCWQSLPNNTWIPRTILPRRSDLRNYYAPQVSFALAKAFKMTERLSLQFKAEAFNALNTPIFGGASTGGSTSAPTPNFFTDPKTGIQTRILPGQPGSFSGYGTVGSTEQNFPRQLQLSLKLLF